MFTKFGAVEDCIPIEYCVPTNPHERSFLAFRGCPQGYVKEGISPEGCITRENFYKNLQNFLPLKPSNTDLFDMAKKGAATGFAIELLSLSLPRVVSNLLVFAGIYAIN